MEKIDTNFTKKIVCPHCGCQFMDSWEYSSNKGEGQKITCQECDKEFMVLINLEVTYTTWIPTT